MDVHLTEPSDKKRYFKAFNKDRIDVSGPGQVRGEMYTKTMYTTRHVFLYNICHIYMSYHILFEGVCFVLSYPTHIWNAYVCYQPPAVLLTHIFVKF